MAASVVVTTEAAVQVSSPCPAHHRRSALHAQPVPSRQVLAATRVPATTRSLQGPHATPHQPVPLRSTSSAGHCDAYPATHQYLQTSVARRVPSGGPHLTPFTTVLMDACAPHDRACSGLMDACAPFETVESEGWPVNGSGLLAVAASRGPNVPDVEPRQAYSPIAMR
jgi:hypothetical protein